MTIEDYLRSISGHYALNWTAADSEERLQAGPTHELPRDFRVLVFAPSKNREMWTYATCGMSQPEDAAKLEIHLCSPRPTALHAELLTAIAHYHRHGAALDLGHTVNFGRSWLPNSQCTHGLLSLPYLDGPGLEWLEIEGAEPARFLWLIPITQSEVTYKKENGVEALESAFERKQFNYLDPKRLPVA